MRWIMTRGACTILALAVAALSATGRETVEGNAPSATPIPQSDCATTANGHKVCGNLSLKTTNEWIRNEVLIGDTLRISLADVNNLTLRGTTYVRAKAGATLSHFAVLKKPGKLSIYIKPETIHFGTSTFRCAESTYFTVHGGTLHRYSIHNLHRELRSHADAGKHIRSAHTKHWVMVGIRVFSIVPLGFSLARAMGEDYISAVGYGTVGAACLIVPSFTLSYSIRTDMERAVGAFNAASK